MLLLHIETATSVCSVALSDRDQLICLEETAGQMNHAATLAPMIESVLEQAGMKPADLGGISLSSGPGSYTGLRVGGASAKAMAYTLQIPLIAIPTLETLAFAAISKYPAAEGVIPMIDARREEVYAAYYHPTMEKVWGEHSVILSQTAVQDLAVASGRVILCGDGAFKAKKYLGDSAWEVDETLLCSALHLIVPAWRRVGKGQTTDPMYFVPSYLKPPNITQPRVGP